MKRLFVALLVLWSFGACSVSEKTSKDVSSATTSVDGVELTCLQLNDVYEISPLEGGKYGGMARVATVKKQLLAENPNTFAFLAGDFISPSAIGTSSYQGKRIHGAQMIDAMNSAGVDYVAFGNHEFDLGEQPLLDRINQSSFTWISSNIRHKTAQSVVPFKKLVSGKEEECPEYVIITAKNSAGESVKIGVIAVTIGSNKPPYIEWSDPIESAERVYNRIKDKTDFVIGLTHLSIDEDRQLAERIPELKLILGGHEHTNMMFKVGETIISKADANARTVYIHRLRWLPANKSLRLLSEVRTIDSSIRDDAATAGIVNEWTTRAYAGFMEKGFSPSEVVARVSNPLDGRESSIRQMQTNLGTLVARSMLAASTNASIAIFNSGSIRVDDQLSGVITEYDIIRTLPFGGKLLEVQLKGSLLLRVLEAGVANAGRGGYLQYDGVAYDAATKGWHAGDKPISAGSTYNIITSDFLFSGNEQGIEFFKRDHPDVLRVKEPEDPTDVRRDIRLAVIRYLKSQQ